MIRIIIEIDDSNQISVHADPIKLPETPERKRPKTSFSGGIKEVHVVNPAGVTEPEGAIKQVKTKNKPPKGKKICVACGKEFVPTSGAQKRCSIECGMKPKIMKPDLINPKTGRAGTPEEYSQLP